MAGVAEATHVTVLQPLVILLTMSTTGRGQVVAALFDSFGQGGLLIAGTFIQCYRWLSEVDPIFTQDALKEVEDQVSSMGVNYVTYSSLMSMQKMRKILEKYD